MPLVQGQWWASSQVNSEHHPRSLVNINLGQRQKKWRSNRCHVLLLPEIYFCFLLDKNTEGQGQLCSQHVCAICTRKTLSVASDSVNLWKAMLHKQVFPCLGHDYLMNQMTIQSIHPLFIRGEQSVASKMPFWSSCVLEEIVQYVNII